MTPGLVSTIIPVFNRPAMLAEAVASVLAQTWPSIEIIIVDDGSTDGTLQAARALQTKHVQITHVLTQANAGPGLARQKGLDAAQGEFIQYLDSDDALLPRKFEIQVAALREDARACVAYGWTRYVHADGRAEPGPWKGSGEQRETMFPAFLRERWWDTPNPLYRRDVCERAGPWTSLRLEEDWEYDCRVAAQGGRLAHCAEYVCEVRDHDGSRLGEGEPLDRDRLAQRARSHRLILESARRAGIAADVPEMRHFSRALFLLSRQCGAAGLARESRELFELSLQAGGTRLADASLDYRAYAALGTVFGWSLLGRASGWFDWVRNHAKP